MKWMMLTALAVAYCFALSADARERTITKHVAVGYAANVPTQQMQVPSAPTPIEEQPMQVNQMPELRQTILRSRIVTSTTSICSCGCNKQGCNCAAASLQSTQPQKTFTKAVSYQKQTVHPPVGESIRRHILFTHDVPPSQIARMSRDEMLDMHTALHSR